jgi:hypothetical protein
MLRYALLSLALLVLRQAPAGSRLHIRLTTAVGSYGSVAGSPVSAVLIAPLVIDGEPLIPEGSTLSGTVTRAQRVGFGIVHETAALALAFTSVTLPNGTSLSVATRLMDVDNSREQILQDGSIHGVRTTSSLSYRFSGYIRTLLCWEVHARIALWVIKTMIVQVPEPEIYYPAGAELTLALTEPLTSIASATTEPSERRLSRADYQDLDQLMAQMPYRAVVRGSNRPSDLVNVMFVGSHNQIAAAFESAGWTEAKPTTIRSVFHGVRAVSESRGFGAAPMSSLLLDNAAPDMAWQKSLNNVAKRHHVRIWKRPGTWNGQEVWVGTATHDVGFAYFRRGHILTHRIEANVDDERDKIVHDLQFTFCADAVDWWQRVDAPRSTRNATGDLVYTDGGTAVIRLNDCDEPRLTSAPDSMPLRVHGNGFQRFLRRQVLSARSDYYRNNIYWRSYEATRWLVTAIHRKRQLRDPAPSGDLDQSATTADSFFTRARNSSWLR